MDEALRKKLAALRAAATGRGTTEAEAMAAAAKMAEIMREHGLNDDDVEYEEAEAPLKGKRPGQRTPLLGVIGVCTNSAATTHFGDYPTVTFLGRAPGPEIAAYLVAVCDRAIDFAVADFKKTPEYLRRRTASTRRAAVQDFMAGMVMRLKTRLFEMFASSIDHDARAEANRVRDLRLPTTSPLKIPERKVRFGLAAQAGRVAAHKVQLAHGVNAGKPVRQIGGA